MSQPIDLKAFALENSWSKKMSDSNGLDSWDNYLGENLGDIVVVPGIGRNRDSGELNRIESDLKRIEQNSQFDIDSLEYALIEYLEACLGVYNE